MDFRFRTVDSLNDLTLLKGFLLNNHLGYPRYDSWVEQVCIPDIENGWKTAILAFYNGYLIGDAIYQQHKQIPRTREFKNLRIHPLYRGRDIGHFLLRQVEEQEKEQFDRILLDIDSRLNPTIIFLMQCGYKKIAGMPLYSPQNLDIIMVKELKKMGPKRFEFEESNVQ